MIYLKEVQPYGFWKEIGHGLSTIGSGIGKGVKAVFSKPFWEAVIPPTELGLQIWLTKEQIEALKKAGYVPKELPPEAGYYQVTPSTIMPVQYQQPVPKEFYYLVGGGIILLLLLILLKEK